MPCLHEKLFYDFSTAEEVCLDCAMVTMERIPCENSTIYAKNTREGEEKEEGNIPCNKTYHYLLELGSRGQFNSCIIYRSIEEYKRLEKSAAFSYTPRNVLAAYCLYFACIIERAPRWGPTP